MKIGDAVEIKPEIEPYLANRKGRIIANGVQDGFFWVQFEGNIQEEPYLFNVKELKMR